MTTRERERLGQAVKGSTVVICVGFLIGSLFGTLIGIADPNGGWAAWRVGVLTGSITAAILLVLCLIVSLIYMAEA